MPWVVPVMAVISAGAAVHSTVQVKRQAKKQVRSAAAIAEANAETIELETAENLRLQEEENAALLATARSKAAASGTSGVSESIFLADLRKKGLEELAWLNTVGASRQRVTRLQGASAVGAAEGKVNAAQGKVVGAFGEFAQATAEAAPFVQDAFKSDFPNTSPF